MTLKLVSVNDLSRVFHKGMKYFVGIKKVFPDTVIHLGDREWGEVCDKGCNFSTFSPGVFLSFILFGLISKPSFKRHMQEEAAY